MLLHAIDADAKLLTQLCARQSTISLDQLQKPLSILRGSLRGSLRLLLPVALSPLPNAVRVSRPASATPG